MFGQQKIMLGDVAVVIICNSNIEKNIQQDGKTKQREIRAKAFVAHNILDRPINAKKPEWLNQEIQKKK